MPPQHRGHLAVANLGDHPQAQKGMRVPAGDIEALVLDRLAATVAHRRLSAAGKPKLIALVAVARKLITILNAILRDRRSWQQISA
jgi:transposase